MADWDESLINAKYHFSVAERMCADFPVFEAKRFIVGVIRELAISARFLIKAFLIREVCLGRVKASRNSAKNLKLFFEKIGPKHLGAEELKTLGIVLEIEEAQKISPVEFLRGDKVGFLVNGNYRFLKFGRLREITDSIGALVKNPLRETYK